MLDQPKELIEKHIKTHTERSAEDEAAVSTLEFFFRSNGRINPLFASNDKWPKAKKLFLTKTHTAIQHLKRRIENPGNGSEFISFDSFTRKVELPDYDIIFVDECSIIDNFTMLKFVNKISEDSLIVLAGDVNQIESIDFGNWFYYAKDIITTHGANVELLDTWRTQEENLLIFI